MAKKMTKVKLFKDYGEYKDDVFVAVNGESYLIQRGVEVEVPDYIAEVLEHSAQQDERPSSSWPRPRPSISRRPPPCKGGRL